MRFCGALAAVVVWGSIIGGLVSPSIGQATPALINSVLRLKLYVDPESSAHSQAEKWRRSRPGDARLMDVLAAQPIGEWFGSENEHLYREVRTIIAAAAAGHAVPVLVAYNIPQRDCGGYSAGGAASETRYIEWIERFAKAIGSGRAIVILEPDALLETECLSPAGVQRRLELLARAVGIFTRNPDALVYIDAGNPGWEGADKVAARLREAGIQRAAGFALNVSNFASTEENIAYGNKIFRILGGKHFVIDTSRNGLGSNGHWCNPSGRAIGTTPTFSTKHERVDAYLWIKVPGESDGRCNGGPAAGDWWADYAVKLVRNALRARNAPTGEHNS